MSLPIVITNAGLAKLPNPDGTGTSAVTIAAIGVSATAIAPDPTMVALPGELSRVTTISGTDITPNTIHLVMEDSSAHAYSMLSFALYLADGTLFAIYGQDTPILVKTASSVALLACDIQFAQAVAAAITFGATTFNNPPASQNNMGVVQLATIAQAQAATDNATALTPLDAINAVVNWIAGKAVNLGSILRAGYQVWDAGNDGAGSGLDADLIHGQTPAALLAPYATTAAVSASIAALFSSGRNSNGEWERRASGIIEQWGQIAIPAGSSSPTGAIIFPIAFSDLTSINITGNAIAGANSSWNVADVTAHATSINGGAWRADSANNAEVFASGDVLQWRAIGR